MGLSVAPTILKRTPSRQLPQDWRPQSWLTWMSLIFITDTRNAVRDATLTFKGMEFRAHTVALFMRLSLIEASLIYPESSGPTRAT